MGSQGGRPRKGGAREPTGRPKRSRESITVPPTKELIRQRARAGITSEKVGMEHPLDIMEARGELLLHRDEDRILGQQRADAGAYFGRLAWHIFGQPFASIDLRTKRLVAPSLEAGPDDAPDPRRAALSDFRTPEERAEDVRCRYEAMRALLQPGSLREWVLRQVAVYCRPVGLLARSASKRERYRVILIEALDLIGDMKAVKRSEDGVRMVWQGRAAA